MKNSNEYKKFMRSNAFNGIIRAFVYSNTIALAVVLGAFFCADTGAEARQVEPFRSGPWTGGVYVDDDTGRFASCMASATYRSGMTMYVLVDRDLEWEFGFHSERWDLDVGREVPFPYRIDRAGWRQAVARAVEPNVVGIPMPADGTVISQFRRGRTMEIFDGVRSYFFDLKGTSRLLPALAECAAFRLALESGGPALGGGAAPGRQSGSAAELLADQG